MLSSPSAVSVTGNPLTDIINMKLRYIALILLIFTINDIHASDCVYAPKPNKEHPYGEICPQGDCGEIVNHDFLRLKKNHFERLSFSKKGLSWILIDNKVFYVSKDGKTMRTHFYDNGPDYFEEGLARTILNKKFGYMDESLKIIIKPRYDFGFPFCNGYAIVCNKCEPEQEGEHREVIGGQWGVINKKGEVVIPIKFEREELKNTPGFKSLKVSSRPLVY